jgi:hypothetical protein
MAQWPYHPFLKHPGGSEMIRAGKMSTMIIEIVKLLHIIQHHKTVTGKARMLHEYQ